MNLLIKWISDWGVNFTQAFTNVGQALAYYALLVIIAVIIFAIGWILAALIEKLVESVFRSLKIDAALRGAGMEEVIKRSGHNLNSGAFIGAIVKWFVIVIFLMSSLQLLGLESVNVFLSSVVDFLPQVIVAVFILMVAAVVSSTMQRVVVASSKAAHVKSAELLGRVTKWTIWVFAIIAALMQLNILVSLLQPILTAVFAGAALAFGLAFGLGGKDVAAKIIEKTSHTIFDKE